MPDYNNYVKTQALDSSPIEESRSLSYLFSNTKKFDDLVDKFVFYTPATLQIIMARCGIHRADLVTSILRNIGGENPIRITDLPNPVFQSYLITPHTRELYVVIKEVWEQALNNNIFEQLCMFSRPHGMAAFSTVTVGDISPPFKGSYTKTLPVRFINSYTNVDSLLFEQTPNGVFLVEHPSVAELNPIWRRLLEMAGQRSNDMTEQQVVEYVHRQQDHEHYADILKLQQQNNMPLDLQISKSINELPELHKNDCIALIEEYKKIFPNYEEFALE